MGVPFDYLFVDEAEAVLFKLMAGDGSEILQSVDLVLSFAHTSFSFRLRMVLEEIEYIRLV